MENGERLSPTAKQALAEAGKPHKSPAVQEYEERFDLSIRVGELEAENARLTANRDYWQQIAREDRAEVDRLRAALNDMISLCRHKASNREEELRVEAAWFALKDTTP